MIDEQTIEWIEKELARFEADEDMEPNNLEVDRMIQTWEQQNPKMLKRLRKDRMALKFARVLQMNQQEAEDQYLAAGYPPTDAREQSEKDWLMLDNPEEEQDPENAFTAIAEATQEAHKLLP